MQDINLYGDLPGLVLVHIIYGIPITTLIFRNYYAGIGTEILEAGRIDGASLMGHISPYHVSAFRAKFCSRDHLAVYPGLE